MTRIREFDESEVLDRAMGLFWARGYARTSFSNLVEGVGVSRQSLYDTYGDKQALFQAALKRYLNRACDNVRRKLEAPGPIRSVIAETLNSLATGACTENAGCFMVNSMIELTPHDPDTRALAQSYARSIEGLFTSRLSAAQRVGEVSNDKDPVVLGRYFFQTILGIAVAARAFGDRDSIQQANHLALRVLD